jgi:hypothetical protein
LTAGNLGAAVLVSYAPDPTQLVYRELLLGTYPIQRSSRPERADPFRELGMSLMSRILDAGEEFSSPRAGSASCSILIVCSQPSPKRASRTPQIHPRISSVQFWRFGADEDQCAAALRSRQLLRAAHSGASRLQRDFATLVLLDGRRLKTQAEARIAVFEFVEGFYNPRPRHSSIGYLSPIDYEHRYAADPDARQPAAGLASVKDKPSGRPRWVTNRAVQSEAKRFDTAELGISDPEFECN